jgi:predicted XRE-type DNA-binding protein
MATRDTAAVKALRSDLALQIARDVERHGQTQVAAAKRLAIPQPTLSKIMRGQVDAVSLELMLKIAVRAGLSVVLQTGKEPAEAGVYVTGTALPGPARTTSRIAEDARRSLHDSSRSLSPEKRLEAQLKHSQLVAELHRAGKKPGTTATRGRR